jgi:hypothetical protein
MKKKETEEERIKREVRLIEYQKAQDSAEHHNNIMWTLINVGIGFSLTILYLAYTNLEILIKLILLFIGSFALFYFSFIIESSNEMKNKKYDICKQIEKEHNFIGQNNSIENLKISKMIDGMKIFRLMKATLWILYVASIANLIIISYKTFNSMVWVGIILNSLAVLGSIIMEITYIQSHQ